METGILERAATLAKENLNKIQTPAREKAEAEAKVAATEKAKADEQIKKDEGIKLAEAEAKTKDDERILGSDDKSLSEPEIKRKAELQETKRKKDESPDEKIKRVQESSQKRIDEIKSEMLAKENSSAERLKKLEAELAELKRPKVEEDAKAKSKREESERIAKYLEADKHLPRTDRREMSEEELDEWYLEEPLKATRWIQKNEIRRENERKAIEAKLEEDEAKNKAKLGADDFIIKQNESKAKLFAKYPGVNPSAEKLASFKGKSNTEIREALSAESEEFRICSEIVAENPKKYLESVNGPELVMAEIEKRLANKSEVKKVVTLTEEELEAKIQAEADRRARLDEGITSTKGKKVEINQGQKSELRQRQEAIAKKAGMTVEQLDKVNARRANIPGASSFNIKDVDEG